jgi:glycosyltransferase A (GT-A) superfamily protein (DUF2064 family)
LCTDTGHIHQQRLAANGLALRELPVLRDVDALADALAVRPCATTAASPRCSTTS